MVRELGFEMKAQPSNRMKTEEELAKEEEERLQSLEVRAMAAGGTGTILGNCHDLCLGPFCSVFNQ